MDNPAKLHKLTVLSQLLVEMHIQTLETQTRVIKAFIPKGMKPTSATRPPIL